MEIFALTARFCDYSTSIKGYSKDTIRRYKYVLRAFSRFTGITEIAQVTDEKVRDLFYCGRIQRNWSVETFIVYHKTLSVFFRWCIKLGYLEHNPVSEIEIPKREKRLPTKLSQQAALKLLEAAYNYPYGYKYLRYRNHAIFATFIFAGLRRQELLNLKFGDVDVENMTLFVRQGKGGKDRIVPMSYALAEILKSYIIERKRLGRTNSEFFSSLRHNSGLTAEGLKNIVSRMRKSTGISFCVHKLRHTFATLMLEGGCDIYSLSQMMGHSDIKTTTIYLSATAEHLRAQISKHPLEMLV